MKALSSKEMAALEKLAYGAGCSEREFMEAAGRGVAAAVSRILETHKISPNVILLCGKGNNGGDAYVAGRHLLQEGVKVLAYQTASFDQCTPLCRENGRRFEQLGGTVIANSSRETIAFPEDGLIIDGLLGTGMAGAPRPPYDGLIRAANEAQLPIISIDIPSGLDGDTGEVAGEAINASLTLFLGLPKVGFFLRDGWNRVGALEWVDFGLSQELIDKVEAKFAMTTLQEFHRLLPPMKRNRHKYEAGYVVGLAGSPGMPGAANLSAAAALKAGAGIVRLLHPKGMEVELSASPYELIKTAYTPGETDVIAEMMNKASAAFIGPGMGVAAETRKLLKELLPKIEVPTVLDADALNIIAQEKIPLPKESLLTPHVGELRRLLGSPSEREPITQSFLDRCRSYVEEVKATLVLKGGPTFVLSPGKGTVVNPTGTPGMATAGSGDVLTGVAAAFLAQGMSCHDAAVAAVYLHGSAGELAAEEKTAYCMTATDLISHFPGAFKHGLYCD